MAASKVHTSIFAAASPSRSFKLFNIYISIFERKWCNTTLIYLSLHLHGHFIWQPKSPANLNVWWFYWTSLKKNDYNPALAMFIATNCDNFIYWDFLQWLERRYVCLWSVGPEHKKAMRGDGSKTMGDDRCVYGRWAHMRHVASHRLRNWGD